MALQALGCFLAQTYEPKELLIFDDATERSFPQDLDWGPAIKYFADPDNMHCPQKRNRVNQMAAGEIICHFDDDDLSHPLRLEDQYRRLIASGGEITGYHSMYFLGPTGKPWKYTGWSKHFGLGSSLMYWRRFWEACHFPEWEPGPRGDRMPVLVGSDTRWVQGRGIKMAAVDAGMMLVARNHGANLNDRSDAALEKMAAENGASWKLCPGALFATG
jgi:glycosyltransferase involved in cell wall biosynthesis